MSDLHMTTAPTKEEIVRWIRSLCATVNIQSVQWPDGSVGLVNVPYKYMAIVDAMFQGLVCLSDGKPLPRLVPQEPAKKKRSK